MKRFEISWLNFVLLNALFITLMNFHLFDFIYSNLDEDASLWLKISFVLIYFSLLVMIFGLLFLPFLTQFFAIVFVLVTCVSAYFMHFYGVVIDKDMIQNALNTDQRELKELFNFTFLFWTVFLGLVPSLLILKCKIRWGGGLRHIAIKFTSIFIALIIVLACFLPQSKTLIPFFRNYNQTRVYNAPVFQIYSFVRYVKQKVVKKPELKIISQDAKLSENIKRKLLVFVIGETARAANFRFKNKDHINDTTAYTSNLGAVYFTEVSSCGTSTAVSVPCMFSVSTRKEYSSSEFQENALDILQKVGVKVSILGNNSGGCQGICKRIAHSKYLDAEFDGALLEGFKKELFSEDEYEIIVLHLQGSHGPTYYKRYPSEFRRFEPTCDTNELQECSSEAIINTYDNTLLYTDFLLSKIITLLQKEDQESSLIYVSDHGESLGENGIYLHAMPYAFAPLEQTEIPLIFYSNDTTLMQTAKAHSNYELSHDYIFSTLLGYFKVQSKFYNPNYDILSLQVKEGL
ncbi:lipid A/FlgG phosphoethanolamine transferase EptC [Campylobacter sp. MIT 12-8780]|uniref:phosphoethanolamine transferase n=1 Tax=Campylobacter sp. MIT 12-8780 TaxID=2202200 RepID=UPI00115E5D90|nr:phosphoethanolamine--lipid A transferase [Campylobacter sp. MIT 12-8780]TQR40828.1 lipid A/FlgG phosphoethanolamine transferase EptC [Campylobacter sp. MIT 12-8780]